MEDLPTILALTPPEYYWIATSCLFSFVHTAEEEWFGDGSPFWDYYWRTFGLVRIGNLLGNLLFWGGLFLPLVSLAYLGYSNQPLTVGELTLSGKFLLGTLIGVRLGDALISHIEMRCVFNEPNPGLATSVLYLIESAVVLAVWSVSPWGLILGFGLFFSFWFGSTILRNK